MSESIILSLGLKFTKSELEAELLRLKDLYYNATLEESKYIAPDKLYDDLVKIYESKFGPYNIVGALPRVDEKVQLPFYMGSLHTKARTPKELQLWSNKYPTGDLIIMDKIDGISAVETSQMIASRGDHVLGSDITRIRDLIRFPNLNAGENVRGEIAIKKVIFEQRYQGQYSSARNIIWGTINGKDSFDPAKVRDFDFLAYRYEDGVVRPQSEQLQILKSKGFKTPWYIQIPQPENYTDFHKYLENLLQSRLTESEYGVDGLVIYNNGAYQYPEDSDPKHVIAFKGKDESQITEVDYVEWNVSKHGLVKPRIRIKPVWLDESNIEWITGNNARYIVDNNIGPGTVVEVIRSGKVIPKIQKIIQATEPDLPKDIKYHWNSNQVEFVADDQDSPQIRIKKIYAFFKSLDAKFVGEKTIEKLYNGGFDTLDKLFDAKIEDLTKVEGIKLAGATRIVDVIQGVITNADIVKIASASGSLGAGFGEKKIRTVFDNFPDFMNPDLDQKEIISKLQSIGGFRDTAYQFAENITLLRDFLEMYPQITLVDDPRTRNFQSPRGNVEHNIEIPINNVSQTIPEIKQNIPVNTTAMIQQQPSKSDKLQGKSIVFTGFAGDLLKELSAKVPAMGGKVQSAVSGKTDILVIKDLENVKGKYHKAQDINAKTPGKIQIIMLDDFLRDYI